MKNGKEVLDWFVSECEVKSTHIINTYPQTFGFYLYTNHITKKLETYVPRCCPSGHRLLIQSPRAWSRSSRSSTLPRYRFPSPMGQYEANTAHTIGCPKSWSASASLGSPVPATQSKTGKKPKARRHREEPHSPRWCGLARASRCLEARFRRTTPSHHRCCEVTLLPIIGAKIEYCYWEWFDRKMVSNSRICWDSRCCNQTIGLVLIARFHWIIHCFPGELSH